MPQYNIVGAHFRPPAKVLLSQLPSSTPLYLQREPDNQYDPNAIKVLCRGEDVPQSEDLENALLGTGYEGHEIASQEYWHLGYIPRDVAEILAPQFDQEPPEGTGVPEGVELAFGMTGSPQAKW